MLKFSTDAKVTVRAADSIVKNGQNVAVSMKFFIACFSGPQITAESAGLPRTQSFFLRIRRLLRTTDTELKAIAAAAIIGFSRKPVNG